jgi:hypothetical protein
VSYTDFVSWRLTLPKNRAALWLKLTDFAYRLGSVIRSFINADEVKSGRGKRKIKLFLGVP